MAGLRTDPDRRDARGPGRGAPEDLHPHLLETADYWLSVGLAMGLRRPEDARRLLEVIESEDHDRTELEADAEAFSRDALG